MMNMYQQNEQTADVEMVSVSEMDYIIQHSLFQMEYEGRSINEMAKYWGVDCVVLYDNINIYKSISVKH